MSRRLALVVLIVILLAGCYFRLAPLPQESLDGDELFSMRIATSPFAEGLAEIEGDLVHPPLYYLLLKGTTTLAGSGQTGLRALSLLCGLATIVIVGWIGLRFERLRLPALVAAAMLALNGQHIYFSQQARSYALYTLLVTLFVAWALWKPEPALGRAYWIAGSVLCVVLFYVHYVGAVYAATVLLAMALTDDSPRHRLWNHLAVLAPAIVLFTPWLAVAVETYHEKGGLGTNLAWQGYPSITELVSVYVSFMGSPVLPRGSTAAVLLGAALVGVTCVAAIGRARSDRRGLRVATILAAAAVVPAVILFLCSLPPLRLPVFGLRQVLPSIVPWCLLVATGVQALGRQWPRRATAIGVTAALLLCGFQLLGHRQSPQRFPYSRIAEDIGSEPLAGLPCFSASQYMIGSPVNYYAGSDSCVQPAVTDPAHLPPQLILLYRAAVPTEQEMLDRLLASGCGVDGRYGPRTYPNGSGSQYFTSLVVLRCGGQGETLSAP